MSPVAAPVAQPGTDRRILIIKLSSLGDVIHALPLLEALRQGLGQNAILGWAIRSKFAEILDGNPALSQSYTLTGGGVPDLWRFGSRLRGERFEVALDTQGLFVSGMVTGLSGARRRIGFDINREGNRVFLTEPVVPGTGRIHVVQKLLGFCDALGVPRSSVRPQRYLAEGSRQEAGELLPATEAPLVGCIVGASTPVKAYPPERWREVIRLLARGGLRSVLLGGPGERETAQAILAGTDGQAIDLTGKTPLRVLASVLARCAVVIGGDSGPTHLAVAVGSPVVGLYGVTDPARTGPNWGCAPALVLDFAEKDAPPAERRPRHPTLTDALARIPPEEVVRAVQSLLPQKRL